ncbi:hypothetical protein ACERK3_04810 [Phycisphaerales bacterium AB-hyl4]|uniref:Uncharacterized protein n=1 Tax=Natronomicrosphaera hydrolytica TaxID=3242702 RepID=A0ABV4U4D3_9BACT
MILRVGPFLYRVRFVDSYIEHEGEKCLGLCDNDAHELLVSTVVTEAQQIQVISHEYMEAWLFHFGENVADKEDYCDLFGMAMTQFVLDLTRQLQQPATQDTPDASADALRHCLDQAVHTHTDADNASPTPTPTRHIATKLARHAAKVGLKVRHVYDGKNNIEP